MWGFIILMSFVVRSSAKTKEEQEINWGCKNLLELDYADDLSILDENVSKMNVFFLCFQSSVRRNMFAN